MQNNASEYLRAKHKQADLLVKDLIKRMGRDDFISFFIEVYEKLNKRVITKSFVESMIVHCPKYITVYLNMMEKELIRKGVERRIKNETV